MKVSSVFNLTTLDTVVETYNALIAKGNVNLGDLEHPLFNRGILLGMEIMAQSIGKSVGSRQLLTHETPARKTRTKRAKKQDKNAALG